MPPDYDPEDCPGYPRVLTPFLREFACWLSGTPERRLPPGMAVGAQGSGSSEPEETQLPTNIQILLDHRPSGKVSPACFRLVEAPVPTPGPGEVLVRHSFLSLDPYMRGRLDEGKSYAKPQEVGAVMVGAAAEIVEASNNPRFKAGDAVVGGGGWQRYSVSDGQDLRVVDVKGRRSRPISVRSACPASPPGTA